MIHLIKTITCVLFIFVLAGLVYGSYDQYIQQGNAAYKVKNWLEAAKNYKNAYLEQPGAQLKKFMDAAIQNAYKEGITKGNTAYKAGNMEDALKWYTQAQVVAPNKQLSSLEGMGSDLVLSIETDKQDKALKWTLPAAEF